MIPNDIEVFARRISEGNQDLRDFDRFFLWLRDRSFGNGLIRDIGDFVAHSHDRDQGHIVSQLTRFRNALSIIHWLFWSLGHSNPPKATPDEIESVALASISFRSDEWCQANLKLRKAQCIQYTKSACRKILGLKPTSGPFFKVDFLNSESLNQREKTVLSNFAGAVPDSVFSDDDVASQLRNALSRNGFPNDVIEGIISEKDFISVYISTLMHSVKVHLSESSLVDLSIHNYDSGLAILGEFTVPWDETQSAMHHPVFTTNCKSEIWQQAVIDEIDAPQFRNARLEIREGKLRPVT